MSSEIGERIVVLGSSGSGKTALARELAARIGATHVELDAPLRRRLGRGARRGLHGAHGGSHRGGAWVVDGNYSPVMRDLAWDRAQTIVWLDLSFLVCGWRLLRRTVLRVARREGGRWPAAIPRREGASP